ncbi:MAG: FKBP-type peptidyl-prolyl cis-trans isomerase [Nanoarchaeota archaeon]|nr:FKBP-type peptidyl-prolyl cis-trans isomerase [Nanoarchaeota archaeon]
MKKTIALLTIIFLSGCITDSTIIEKTTVQSGDSVNVNYTGTLINGTIFDSGSFSFIVGSGQVIAGFDKGVLGMEEGETKTIIIPPTEAYGEYSNVPITAPFDVINSSVFNNGGINADVGILIYLITTNGDQILGRITSIENGTVKIVQEKNHALQGETLVFEITINNIE